MPGSVASRFRPNQFITGNDLFNLSRLLAENSRLSIWKRSKRSLSSFGWHWLIKVRGDCDDQCHLASNEWPAALESDPRGDRGASRCIPQLCRRIGQRLVSTAGCYCIPTRQNALILMIQGLPCSAVPLYKHPAQHFLPIPPN